MQKRKLGRTDMRIGRLGFGGARIGFDKATQAETTRILHSLIEAGVNFLDTAECYDASESLMGKALADRRSEVYVATKCGHAAGEVDGEEFSGPLITASIEQSLRRLRTDYVDLVQLHSCSAEALRQGEVVDSLLKAKKAGKTRYIGYSGDGEAAEEAVKMGVFDTLQTSFNVVDQKAADVILPLALAAGMGIIAKRPVANGAFGRQSPPSSYANEYWRRSQQIQPPEGAPNDPMELALRFVLSFDEIDVAIVGTSKAEHALRDIQIAELGGLEPTLVEDLRRQFRRYGATWGQMT